MNQIEPDAVFNRINSRRSMKLLEGASEVIDTSFHHAIPYSISPSHGQPEPAQTNLRLLDLPPNVQHAPRFLLQTKNSTIPLEGVANDPG